MPHRGDKKGDGEEGKCGGEESTVKQEDATEEETLSESRNSEERRCVCERRGDRDQEEDERGVKIQLLSSSSVAVSTSQDFDDNATITAF